jgi:hypothetical protein
MAITPDKIGPLRPSKAPNLLIAPVDYSQQYQDQLNNAMRLYFNQVDSFTQAVAIPDSGKTINRPISNNVQVPLAIGQQFYDTTLGIPIWWNGTVWKNASGTTV